MSKYFGGFAKREDVAAEFQQGVGDKWDDKPFIPVEGFPTDDEILFAAYETPSYEGYALVLYERDGVLYQVNGSHCSCYGLEHQWKPEETSWAAIKKAGEEMLPDYQDYTPEARDAFAELLRTRA